MFKKLAAAAALIVVSSSAFALEPNSLYVGLDAGKTKFDDALERQTSVGVVAGYRMNANFSAEFGYRVLADTKVSGVDVKVDELNLSLIGSLPLGNKFDVYARLGYNSIEARATARGFRSEDSSQGNFAGVGLGYAFTPAISGRIEFQKPSSDSTNVSAGVLFRF